MHSETAVCTYFNIIYASELLIVILFSSTLFMRFDEVEQCAVK